MNMYSVQNSVILSFFLLMTESINVKLGVFLFFPGTHFLLFQNKTR